MMTSPSLEVRETDHVEPSKLDLIAWLLLAAATAVRAVTQDVSRRMAQRGGKAVATALREALLPSVLPVADTPHPENLSRRDHRPPTRSSS
jgi:ABC-type transport system involved in cytochrome bd biosynthesis fused ATPase/permease subunit